MLSAPALVQVHAAAATLALATGTMAMLLAKGTKAHLWLGRTFAVAMLATALTSFGITRVDAGHFSPIHLLAILTIITLPIAIWQRRRGNILAHARGMIILYVSLVVAGGFTLVPSRILGQMFWTS